MNFKNWLTKADEIKDKCQPFLQMTKIPLYRGVAIMKPTDYLLRAKTATVRLDRKPRDSAKHIHTLVDDWFYKNHKLKPRSQGLFCTSDMAAASKYGQLAYIFPVGKFRYMWASIGEHALGDSVLYMSELRSELSSYYAAETDAVLKRYTFHVDTGFISARKNDAEIILFCDEVILVPAKRIPNYDMFRDSLK